MLSHLSNHIVNTETMGNFKGKLDKFKEEDDLVELASSVRLGTAMSRPYGLLHLPSFSYVLIYK